MFRFIGKNVNKIMETFQRQRFVTNFRETFRGVVTCSSKIVARGQRYRTKSAIPTSSNGLAQDVGVASQPAK